MWYWYLYAWPGVKSASSNQNVSPSPVAFIMLELVRLQSLKSPTANTKSLYGAVHCKMTVLSSMWLMPSTKPVGGVTTGGVSGMTKTTALFEAVLPSASADT